MTNLNIYQKLNKIQTEIKAISKNGINDYGKYKYWLLSDILTEFKELLKKYEVTFIHGDIKDTFNFSEIETYNKQGQLIKEKQVSYLKEYKLISNNLEDSILFNCFVAGKNSDIAKAKGSAETYGLRYFLMNLLLISEDELDSDHNLQSQNINNNWEPSGKQLLYLQNIMQNNNFIKNLIQKEMQNNNNFKLKELIILKGKSFLDEIFKNNQNNYQNGNLLNNNFQHLEQNINKLDKVVFKNE